MLYRVEPAVPVACGGGSWNATRSAVMHADIRTRGGRKRNTAARAHQWRRACEGITCTFLQTMSRGQLFKLLNTLNFRGQSAEVGVWRGQNSLSLLRIWTKGGHHHLVDPYLNFGAACSKHLPKGGDKQCRVPQQRFDHLHSNVSSAFAQMYPGRVTMLRNLSVAAANTFPASSLAFVYVDARHDYAGVIEDVRAWWRVLEGGGIFAGHDYTDSTPWKARQKHTTAGGKLHRTPVAEALRDFLQELGPRGAATDPKRPELFITAEHPASWFMFKPCQQQL